MPEPEGNTGQGSAPSAVYSAPFDPAQHVPETVRSSPYFESFKGKTLGDVLVSAVEAQKALGGKVSIPGADSKDEDWQNFYSKLRPAKDEDYGKPEWTDKEFGAKLEGPVLDELRKASWEAGLHPKQLKHILKVYESALAGQVKTMEQQGETARNQAIADLKAKYGDKFDEASRLSNRAAKRYGGQEFVDFIKENHFDADPRFFNTFYELARQTHEDSWHTGDAPKLLSRDAASAKVNEIMKDPSHPFHKANHPQHAAAVEQVNGLRKIQYAKRDDE